MWGDGVDLESPLLSQAATHYMMGKGYMQNRSQAIACTVMLIGVHFGGHNKSRGLYKNNFLGEHP